MSHGGATSLRKSTIMAHITIFAFVGKRLLFGWI